MSPIPNGGDDQTLGAVLPPARVSRSRAGRVSQGRPDAHRSDGMRDSRSSAREFRNKTPYPKYLLTDTDNHC